MRHVEMVFINMQDLYKENDKGGEIIKYLPKKLSWLSTLYPIPKPIL